MQNVGKLTDKQYDLLTACFKNRIPQEKICELTGLSWNRVSRERERWRLCRAITSLRVKEPEPTWTRLHPSNCGRVFC